MRGNERDNRVLASIRMPAVVERKEWKYNSLGIVITESADKFLVQHVLWLVRS